MVSDIDQTLFARINDRLSYDENKFKTEKANFKEGNLFDDKEIYGLCF